MSKDNNSGHPLAKTAAGAAILMLLFGGFGLGGIGFGGGGNGNGSGTASGSAGSTSAGQQSQSQPASEASSVPVSSAVSSDSADSESQGGLQGLELTIVVKADSYLIGGEAYTLTEIEDLLKTADPDTSSFTVEDNFAAAKAWDELMDLFTRYEISAVEK